MSISVKRFPRRRSMNYDDIRFKIRSGDILLCSGSGMVSKMIKKATKSVWSHVGFVIRLDSIGRVMVLESVEPIGVRTVPLSHYVKNYKGNGKGYPGKIMIARHSKFNTIPTESYLYRMSQFAVDLFGYPYDKDEILRIIARIGMGIFGFRKRDVKRDKEYICSEYVWECFKSIGIEVPYDKRGFIAPSDFAKDKNIYSIDVVGVKR